MGIVSRSIRAAGHGLAHGEKERRDREGAGDKTTRWTVKTGSVGVEVGGSVVDRRAPPPGRVSGPRIGSAIEALPRYTTTLPHSRPGGRPCSDLPCYWWPSSGFFWETLVAYLGIGQSVFFGSWKLPGPCLTLPGLARPTVLLLLLLLLLPPLPLPLPCSGLCPSISGVNGAGQLANSRHKRLRRGLAQCWAVSKWPGRVSGSMQACLPLALLWSGWGA